MWKDFFYFSKGQRIGIIVLLVLIAMVFVIDFTLPYFFRKTEKTDPAFLEKVNVFRKSLQSRDSIRQIEWQKRFDERNYSSYRNYKKQLAYSLFVFDPNVVDSSTFVRLGIKNFVASNILKYRNKGGVFRTKNDFGKVYGILPDKFKELEPYIHITQNVGPKIDTVSLPIGPHKRSVMVDLNSADTTQLMQVKGIGRGYAKGIVRFRKTMGGFVSVNQLTEIYGMRPENFEKISPFCYVNVELVHKIDVNTASVERLNAHPYINFYQAKAIYELRRSKGKLININELNSLPVFSEENINKIKPYLNF